MSKSFCFEVIAEDKDLKQKIISKRKPDDFGRPFVLLDNYQKWDKEKWRKQSHTLSDNDINIYVIQMGINKQKTRHLEITELGPPQRKGAIYFIEQIVTNGTIYVDQYETYEQALAKAKELSLSQGINLIIGARFPNHHQVVLCEITCTTTGYKKNPEENERTFQINKYLVIGRELDNYGF